MNTEIKIKSKVRHLSRSLILKTNYALNNYDEVLWLLGDGRSGTTWVSDLINHDKRYREMFEPFHPNLIPEMSFIEPHQYIGSQDVNKKLARVASDIFSGKFINERVDCANSSFVYKGILVKDIFANLLCHWASLQFPKVKPVLLIRNPFPVAISKYKKKKAFWLTEPLNLLNQKSLREDYLLPFEDIIKETSYKKNYILNQVLIWSIINYIPLCQFNPHNLHICFYEDIYTEPNREISKILQFVRGASNRDHICLTKEYIERLSRVTGSERNLLADTSPLLSWQNQIPSQIIDEGLRILQHFGFDNLYDDRSMPNIDVLKKIQQTE